MSRRIVAATGADSKSCVVSEETIPAGGNPQPLNLTNVWTGAIARADNSAPFAGGFAPFAMSQMYDPAYSVMLTEHAPGQGASDPGMHFTNTTDHFYMIEGELVLVLENGEAVLREGDIGICRGAVHGWRNDSARIARMLTFVVPAEPLAR